MNSTDKKLAHQFEKLFRQNTQGPFFGECSVAVDSPKRSLAWSSDGSSKNFIASSTKLFTSALIFKLFDSGALSPDSNVQTILGKETVSGLHNLKGVDHSSSLRVDHLLNHTSGLADYFEQKPDNGQSIGEKIFSNHDCDWSFTDVLNITKQNLSPRFKPGLKQKTFYSDTNFQLLGAIIEKLYNTSYKEAVENNVIKPLGLSNTWLFNQGLFSLYPEIRKIKYGKQVLNIPLAMSSFGCDGGIVSSPLDQIRFLKGFFNAELFNYDFLTNSTYRRIFFPLKYGMGHMLFKLPPPFSLFTKSPQFIGHSGASGNVMYYDREEDIYIALNINQAKKRDIPYKLLMQLHHLTKSQKPKAQRGQESF